MTQHRYDPVRGNRLGHDARSSILDAIEAHPTVSLQEVAAATGLTYEAVRYHLRRLVRAKTVIRVKHPRQSPHLFLLPSQTREPSPWQPLDEVHDLDGNVWVRT